MLALERPTALQLFYSNSLPLRGLPLTEEGEFLRAIVTKKLSLYD